MAGNFEYYAELGLNAGAAISELSRVSSTAQTVSKNLEAMGKALDQVSKQGLKSGPEAKQLGDTLGLYQQLAAAVASYGRSLKTINSTDLNNGVRKTNTSLQHMEKALRGVSGTDKEVYDSKKRTLDLYKQMTSATKAQADTLKAEADAIKAVAQAERERQATAAAAERAKTSGVDAWGVTKEERDLRKQYQTVLQAEKEMEAEFERRAREHLKASGLYARGEEPIRKVTEATEDLSAATDDNAAAQDRQERALASTRYALYEVAAAYSAMSASMLALPVAGTRAAIEMEAQFAHVERTTQLAGAPLENLRQQFLDMSTEIPVAFEELSKIGTLGAQMGIAGADLASFTDTVAKFSATTNATVDQAAMSFGRLSNMMQLSEDDYVHLGSAVSELGTASVATETEILNIAESIATTANMAGFSADQVVGLSTAMASLRIRPEMARGAMQRIFAKINKAAADGGESLSAFAQQVGMTNDQFVSMWRNDPSALFMRLTESIQGLDKVAATATMGDLGITNTRDVELLNRLANGYRVYAESMELAQDAYARGDYLETETGPIFETTAAHLERLAAAFQAFLASFGTASLEPINALVEFLIGALNWLRELPDWLKTGTVAFTAFIGVWFALKASMALTIASFRAFRLIAQQTNGELRVNLAAVRREAGLTFPFLSAGANGAAASLNNVGTASRTAAAGMGATTAAAGAATTATRGLSVALRAVPFVGWASLAVSAATAVWQALSSTADAATEAQEASDRMVAAMGGAAELQQALLKDAREFASGEQTEVFGEMEYKIVRYEGAVRSASDAIRGEVLPTEENHKDRVRETGDEYLETMGKIGKYTDQLIRTAVAQSDVWEGMTHVDIDNLLATGFDFEKFISEYEQNGASAAHRYVDSFVAVLEERQVQLAAALEEVFTTAGEGSQQYDILSGQLAVVDAQIEAFQRVKDSVADTTTELNAMSVQSRLTGLLGAEAAEDMAEGFEETTERVKELSDTFSDLIDEIFGVVNAEAALYEALQNIGEALADNGTSFDVSTENGRANMAALQRVVEETANYLAQQVEANNMTAAEAADAFFWHMEDLMNSLSEMGVDPSEFVFIRSYLDELFVHNPLTPEVDTSVAEQALYDLAEYGQRVFESLRQQGVSSGMAASGARYSAMAVAQGHTPTGGVPVPVRRAARPEPRSRIDYAELISSYRAAQNAKNEANQRERSANEAKRQADETKRAADEAKKLKDEIADAKDEGRIFEEIMKGLSSAFKDTLHNFNNFQTARDSVEQQLINMRNAAQESADKVRELREEHRRLRQEASEDRVEARQAESFAAVARRYGDTEREIDYSTQAKNARASAKEKERLAREALNEANSIEKNRLALTGYSEQAIKNRGDVRALQERMADLILAYAETGATTQEVTAYAEQLRRKFIDQMVQMGYNRQDAERLSRVFQNLKTDIDRIPRQVRIEAQARVKEAEAALRNVARGRTAKVDFVPGNKQVTFTAGVKTPSLDVTREVKAPTLDLRGYGNGITSNWVRSGGGLIPGPSHGPAHRDDKIVIGRNGPEGMVRSGEFVIRKPAVDAIGLNALHALNSMSPGAAVMSSAPAVNASRGVQLVELLPHQVHQLAQAVSTVLAVDGKVLAGTTNAQNTNAARRGVK